MSIDITARHIEVSTFFQDYARAKAEQLMVEFPNVEYVHVIIDRETHDFVAEFVVQGRNHIRVESEGRSENARAALDIAFEKAERQLRKSREKMQSHRA